MENFNATQVDNLRKEILKKVEEFSDNSMETLNKSAARRARKNTLELTQLMKDYRKYSIKA